MGKITHLFFVAALFTLCVFSKASHAKLLIEEDGGLTDHGGGGTFVLRKVGGRPVLFDLYLLNPKMVDNEAGDSLSLSSQGLAAGGEWIDYRSLKSAGYLEERLSLWKERAPNLVALLKKSPSRPLPIIATSWKIQKINEISVNQYSGANFNEPVVSGAYYDYTTGRIFLDIELFNQAGLLSQSALLLHERLRELQRHFEFSNEILQEATAVILLLDPKTTPVFFDARFLPSFYKERNNIDPLAPAQRPAPAAQEIAEAQAKGFLGNWRAVGQIGAKGNLNKILDGGGQIIIQPLTCLRNLNEMVHASIATDPLGCLEGNLVGSGQMNFLGEDSGSQTFTVNAHFSEGAKLEFQVFKSATYPNGILVSFEQKGSFVEVRVDGKNPVQHKIDRAQNFFSIYEVAISNWDNSVTVKIRPSDDPFGEDTSIQNLAIWKISEQIVREAHGQWGFSINGIILNFLRFQPFLKASSN